MKVHLHHSMSHQANTASGRRLTGVICAIPVSQHLMCHLDRSACAMSSRSARVKKAEGRESSRGVACESVMSQTFKEKVSRTPAGQVMREVFSGNIPGDDAAVKTKSRCARASNREFMLCCCILALVAPAPTHLVAPAPHLASNSLLVGSSKTNG